ncbi:hypothetical protein [Actinomadura sp. DC4]|uniref:hypothetical protein n=1 Tax=Actinomadura sp. DC4 TaxID=3055069 RepID=UPI0025B00A8A|nr:hypothetical protein [Actinomadura sp. DC4]MDN3359158.1 hypothetical protein [Actinomadura sp. DC4]
MRRRDPDGVRCQDPISAIIAIPGLVATAVIVPLWLTELLLRLLFAPFVIPFRLASVVPYHLELFRAGRLRGTYTPNGRAELVRLRRRLTGRDVPGGADRSASFGLGGS